jgi:dihydrolipoamide dehydrogenase
MFTTARAASFRKITIAVKKNEGETVELETAKVIIATGSKPATLQGITIDKKELSRATEALTLKEIPKEMIVIGGGVIGCEMASVYARLGTKVRIVEYFDSLIATHGPRPGQRVTADNEESRDGILSLAQGDWCNR